MDALTIRAVAYEESGVWIVQGVEYDICTHANDPSTVPAAFARAVIENIAVCKHLGREPLEGIKPAPDRFRRMFEEANTKLTPVRDLGLPPLPISEMDIRLRG